MSFREFRQPTEDLGKICSALPHNVIPDLDLNRFNVWYVDVGQKMWNFEISIIF